MDLRERVQKAISHQEVFPVPVDLFENGVYPELGRDLYQHFQIPIGDLDGLLDKLGSSIRWGNPTYQGPALEEKLGLGVAYPFRKAFKNIWGTWDGLETYSPNIFERPLAKAESTADIHAHTWPNPDWFDFSRIGVPFLQPDEFIPIDKWSRKYQNYLRIGGGWCPIASRVLDLFGMETGLINIASRPDLIHATMQHISDFYIEYYNQFAQVGRGYFDVLGFGDDFATQKNLLFSPTHWRKYFLPLWKELFAIAHKNGMKSMMHSCGAIAPVIGDLIDAGLDILEVVQITAKGMGAEFLKTEYGKDLVFYGGIDVQNLMPYGTEQEVRAETRRLIDIFGRDGGYILVTSHFLMDDVPYQNVIAMYEEGNTYIPERAAASS